MFATTLKKAGRPKACFATMLAAAASAAAVPASADVVAQWNAIAADTITPPPGVVYPAVTPEELRPIYSADLATVHVAIFDAVNAITGGYEVFAVAPVSPTAGASAEAAAGAAACRVLQVSTRTEQRSTSHPACPIKPKPGERSNDAGHRRGHRGRERGSCAARKRRALHERRVCQRREPGDFRGVNRSTRLVRSSGLSRSRAQRNFGQMARRHSFSDCRGLQRS